MSEQFDSESSIINMARRRGIPTDADLAHAGIRYKFTPEDLLAICKVKMPGLEWNIDLDLPCCVAGVVNGKNVILVENYNFGYMVWMRASWRSDGDDWYQNEVCFPTLDGAIQDMAERIGQLRNSMDLCIKAMMALPQKKARKVAK